MKAKPTSEIRGDAEIEIEFDSELGRVFVMREGASWRCAVQLAGQGQEGEGSLGADGTLGTAYQCFEYLSHLLKHDNLFSGRLPEDDESDDAHAAAAQEIGADGEPTPEKASLKRGRKKRY